MYTVQKKTAHEETKALLIQAFRDRQSLSWDRYDAMQPQCGFGRLAISCTECLEGPCRVNPFDEEGQKTICGRERADLVANFVLQKAYAGAEALTALAGASGAGEKAAQGRSWNASDSMLGAADAAAELAALAPWIASAMKALSGTRAAPARPLQSAVNFGVLQDGKANIALHGHLPAARVKELLEAAKGGAVNIVGLCGSEGYFGLPLLGNYGSQELALISGKVDLLITGSQCVMPACKRLAETLGVPVLAAVSLGSAKAVQEAFAKAEARAKNRKAMKAPLGAVQAFSTGFSAASCADLFAALEKGVAKGGVRGLAYVGGCGSIAHTQDADLVKLAKDLLDQGYVLATAGCAGTALARAGLCDAGCKDVPETLRAAVPAAFPLVLHLGACHDAAVFMDLAAQCKAKNIPMLAVVPEPVHSKAVAVAVGLAGGGVPTYLDSELFSWLPENMLNGMLRPLSALSQ